jgi:hypothetical protein
MDGGSGDESGMPRVTVSVPRMEVCGELHWGLALPTSVGVVGVVGVVEPDTRRVERERELGRWVASAVGKSVVSGAVWRGGRLMVVAGGVRSLDARRSFGRPRAMGLVSTERAFPDEADNLVPRGARGEEGLLLAVAVSGEKWLATPLLGVPHEPGALLSVVERLMVEENPKAVSIFRRA